MGIEAVSGVKGTATKSHFLSMVGGGNISSPTVESRSTSISGSCLCRWMMRNIDPTRTIKRNSTAQTVMIIPFLVEDCRGHKTFVVTAGDAHDVVELDGVVIEEEIKEGEGDDNSVDDVDDLEIEVDDGTVAGVEESDDGDTNELDVGKDARECVDAVEKVVPVDCSNVTE